MANPSMAFEGDRKNTDLAEGELETVEESIEAHDGHECLLCGKTPDQGSHTFDLAEGEPETIDESIRIHERKGDL